jgi:archaellin
MTIDIRRFRYVAAVLAAVCVAAGAYAFTASNTVPGTNAGSGAGTISGYTVSNVAYTLNGTDPTKMDTVTFTLDKAAGTVKAQVQSSGSWYGCTNSSGNNWSCDTTSPQASVAPADQLSVVATS